MKIKTGLFLMFAGALASAAGMHFYQQRNIALQSVAATHDGSGKQRHTSKHQQTYEPQPGDLSAARLHQSPSLSGPRLSKAKISPDGSMVTMLRGRDDDAFQNDLWASDLRTGEGKVLVSSTELLSGPEILSDEEKNRRERAREYGNGIIAYEWDEKGEKILFPLGGDIFIYDLKTKTPTQITKTDGFETDAKLSASGELVTYIRGNELYQTEIASGAETKITSGATHLIRNGIASFVVQEELARSTGYWLSPDEKQIAFTQIDESLIAIEERIEFTAAGIKNIAQRYPFAGTDNATVKLGITGINGGAPIWADIGDDPDIYLARVAWSANGEHLYVSILSRDHKRYEILKIDPKTGSKSLLFTETSPTWINVRGEFYPLEMGGFLWTSERSGFRHIYHIGNDGDVKQQITSGNWLAAYINCIDEKSGDIFFTGWTETPLEQHVYKTGFDGAAPEKITKGAGSHSARFSGNCAAFIGRHSDINTPPKVRTFSADGSALIWLNENTVDAVHPYGEFLSSHIKPKFGQIKAADGTMLDYSIYVPPHASGDKLPSITLVYGGPLAQRVKNSWSRNSAFAQWLVDRDYVVFQIDGRGAGNRGKKFEDHLYRALGKAEIVDQSAGARWLESQAFIDPDRMGIYGWSYGGYMVLHMLAQTDLYKAGVSGAPVTDWALYDTAYTERYLGDPRPNNANYTKGAYEDGAVMAHLDGLTEPFLLIHGMADDNVVFRHSIVLMDKLQAAGQHNMRLMTYPGEKHGFRKEKNKIHKDEELIAFFDQYLQ